MLQEFCAAVGGKLFPVKTQSDRNIVKSVMEAICKYNLYLN